MLTDIPENELTEKIIGLAIEVHRTFGGPGLKESAYEAALEWELKNAGLEVERQKPVPIASSSTVEAATGGLDWSEAKPENISVPSRLRHLC